jgi:hypothetical protein
MYSGSGFVHILLGQKWAAGEAGLSTGDAVLRLFIEADVWCGGHGKHETMRRAGKKNTSRTLRQPYSRSKRFDKSCRNHGGCPYCEESRLHSRWRSEMDAEEQVREFAREE